MTASAGHFDSSNGAPRRKGQAVPRDAEEPIAVIGLSCRFPGGANDPASLWKLLIEGGDVVREVPHDRWSPAAFFAPAPPKPGKTFSRWGGFLESIDLFDAGFFGISPREAASMDPQQRIMLEVSWEALESAGLTHERRAARPVGVFVGASFNDYMQMQWDRHQDHGVVNAYSNVGGALSIIANRLSHQLDLRGPSLVIDTACSSSLVAFHYACESIRRGESEVALAAGVNLIQLPVIFIGFSQAQMLSPDGRCRSFDARANGYARSEGAGAVVLKPLARALADGDAVEAVVLATGVNQDGRTTGISLPNEEAQVALLNDVYARAGIAPREVGYFEAHGTGTPVGDPIEARAIGRVLGAGRSPHEPLAIGSVKSNLGHLESASGIAGVIKTILCLRQRQLPPTLHFSAPNPAIDFEGLRLRVVSRQESWPAIPGRRIAGINSFGFGGTNAHAVIAEALPAAAPDNDRHAAPVNTRIGRIATENPDAADSAASASPAWLIPISARSDAALKAQAKAWIDWLQRPDVDGNIGDMAYNAALRRTHHDHRLSIVSHSTGQLQELLEAWLRGEARREVSFGKSVGRESRKIAFVFNGMGSQWAGMGQELLHGEPEFCAAVGAVDAAFRAVSGWSIVDQLTCDEFRSRIHEVEVTQPAIFAVQVGLARLWQSWGVEPELVTGHSVGEVAAAHVAGILSLEEATKVIFHRSRLQHRLRGQGRMLAVGMPRDLAESLIAGYDGKAAIAAVNSPSSVTLSGERDALEELRYGMESSQTFCRFLQVDVAYHSPSMETIRDELRSSLAGIDSRPPSAEYFSTVSGARLDGRPLDADYWWSNVRSPVLFASAIEAMFDAGAALVIEIGAHPVLASSIRECAGDRADAIAVLASMRRGEPQQTALLSALGQVHTLGFPISWRKLLGKPRPAVSLPAYAWQRESYWSETEESRASRLGLRSIGIESVLGHVEHPLLGHPVRTAHEQRAFHATYDAGGRHAWLADHKVHETPVFPGAGYVELALAAARRQNADPALCAECIDISRPLVLPSGRETSVETLIDMHSGDVSIRSRDADGDWTSHATAKARADFGPWNERADELEACRGRCPTTHDIAELYDWFAAGGLGYGRSFQGIEEVRTGRGEGFGRAKVPRHLRAELDDFVLHPALLDASLQIMLCAARHSASPKPESGLYVPVRLARIRLRDGLALSKAAEEGLLVTTLIAEQSQFQLRADAALFDQNGRLLAEVEGLSAMALPASGKHRVRLEDCLWDHRWELQPLPGEDFADPLPRPHEIADALAPRIATLREQFDRRAFYSEIRPALEKVGAAFANQALRELGAHFAPGQKWRFRDLLERLGVAPRREGLLEAMLECLEHTGQLRLAADGLEVLGELSAEEAHAVWRSTGRRWPCLHPDLLLLWRVGSKLKELLRGEVDPSEVCFPDGSSALVDQLLADGSAFRIDNMLLQETLEALVARLPAERPLRILQTGGMTGAATSYLLLALPAERTEYVFTDASPESVKAASQRFRDYPFVRCAPCDLQQTADPLPFERRSFDVIIASRAISAATDHRLALERLQPLLVPGGLLVLFAATSQRSVYDLMLGGLTAWRSSTCAGQGNWPRSPPPCQELLEQAGYEDAVRLTDAEAGEIPVQTIFLARAPAPSDTALASEKPVTVGRMDVESVRQPRSAPGTWWIIAGNQLAIARQLAQRLDGAGGRAVVICRGNSFRQIEPQMFELRLDSHDDYRSLFRQQPPVSQAPAAIVHVASCGASLGECATADDLRQAQISGSTGLLILVQALAESASSPAPRVWVVTRTVQPTGLSAAQPLNVCCAPLWGMARVIANEAPQLALSAVDLGPVSEDCEIDALYREIASGTDETEVLLRGRRRYVPRLVGGLAQWATAESREYRVEAASPGILESVGLAPASTRVPGPGEIEIEVVAAAVNFKDVAKALSLLSPVTLEGTWSGRFLGLECAGTVSALGPEVTDFSVGDRVVAIAADCFRRHVVTRAEFAVRLPDHLGFEEAAGIPIVFLTAEYALRNLARIQPGERLLVHAGAGGVGLAALQIAQGAGADVIATAGSALKREFLKAQGMQHVFDSRGLSFVDDVRRVTGGEGVDVVLNSLSGAAVPAGLSLLREGGRFVEIGKRDIQENVRLGLKPFDGNLAFLALDFDRLLARRASLVRASLQSLMRRVDERTLSPLPYRAFPVSRADEAFRHLAKARQIGKIVLRMDDPRARPKQALAIDGPKLRFEAGTYLVTGGLSGFGLATAKWLVERGARHLALLSRRGADSIEAAQHVAELEAAGARVVALACDVSNDRALENALASIRRDLPCLTGVFHAAMVLDDAEFRRISPERLENVLAPKGWGAWNLHRATRNDPLEHFVLFSSGTTFFGNPGQTNYVAACAFLDSLAHHRRALGLPALSVAWGAIGDVGYLARNHEVLRHLDERMGLAPVPAAKMLEFLEQLMAGGVRHAGVFPADWSRVDPARLAILSTPRMAHLASRRQTEGTDSTIAKTAGRAREALAACPPGDRRQLLNSILVETVAAVLGAAPSRIETDKALTLMGMDSLMAVELQTRVRRELGAEVSSMRLMSGPSIDELTIELMPAIGGKDAEESSSTNNSERVNLAIA